MEMHLRQGQGQAIYIYSSFPDESDILKCFIGGHVSADQGLKNERVTVLKMSEVLLLLEV